MKGNIWQLQEAKSKFSQLVEQVLASGAQIITRHGKKTVVILPYAEFEALTQRAGSLSSFLRRSPLAGSNLVITRDTDLPREIEVEP